MTDPMKEKVGTIPRQARKEMFIVLDLMSYNSEELTQGGSG